MSEPRCGVSDEGSQKNWARRVKATFTRQGRPQRRKARSAAQGIVMPFPAAFLWHLKKNFSTDQSLYNPTALIKLIVKVLEGLNLHIWVFSMSPRVPSLSGSSWWRVDPLHSFLPLRRLANIKGMQKWLIFPAVSSCRYLTGWLLLDSFTCGGLVPDWLDRVNEGMF